METKTVIQKPEIKDNSEYKINRRTREGKLLHSLLNKEQIKSAKLVKVIDVLIRFISVFEFAF